MRAITYAFLTIVFSLVGCSSQKKLVQDPPFEVGSASCQSWKGARAESGSGMFLTIPMTGEYDDNLKLQQAYFRGKTADIDMETSEDGSVAKANFTNYNREKPDMVMDADPKKEVGNQPPQPKEKFPFELEPDQCVVSYLDGETIKYFKVEGIKEKAPLIYK